VHEGTNHACPLSAIGALWACRPRHPWSGRQGVSHPARPEPCPLVRKLHQALHATPSQRSATQLAGIASKPRCSSAASARVATVTTRAHSTQACVQAFCSPPAPRSKPALPPCASRAYCHGNPAPQFCRRRAVASPLQPSTPGQALSVALRRYRHRDARRSPLSLLHPLCSHGRVSRRPPPVTRGRGYKGQPPDLATPLHPPPPHSNCTPRKETPAGEAPGKGSSPEPAVRSFTVATVLRCSQGTPISFHSLLALCDSPLTPRHGPLCSAALSRRPSSAAAHWRQRSPRRPATVRDATGTGRLLSLRSVR
jgi:hypothetical protein